MISQKIFELIVQISQIFTLCLWEKVSVQVISLKFFLHQFSSPCIVELMVDEVFPGFTDESWICKRSTVQLAENVVAQVWQVHFKQSTNYVHFGVFHFTFDLQHFNYEFTVNLKQNATYKCKSALWLGMFFHKMLTYHAFIGSRNHSLCTTLTSILQI